MYWLLGGSFTTIPGFIAGALISFWVASLFVESGEFAVLSGVFGGLAGEALYFYVLEHKQRK